MTESFFSPPAAPCDGSLSGEQLLRAVIEASDDLVAYKDAKLLYLGCNQAFARFSGRAVDDIVGRGEVDVLGPETAEMLSRLERQVLASGMRKTVCVVMRDAGGREVCLDTQLTPILDQDGRCRGLARIMRDETAQHETTEALQKSEARYRAIFECAGPGLAVIGLSGSIHTANPALAAMAGRSADSLRDVPFQHLFAEDVGEEVARLMADLAAGSRERFRLQGRLAGSRVRDLWVQCTATLMRSRGGVPLYAFALVDDVTERKLALEALRRAHDNLERRVAERTKELEVSNTLLLREVTERRTAEELLRESEERLRRISDSAADGIIMIDNDGLVTFWNPAASRLFGYAESEAVGRELEQLVVPERFRQAHQRNFAIFRKSGHGRLIGKTIELIARRQDGFEFPVELSLSSTRIRGRWHAIGTLRDATQRVEMERALRAAKESAEAASQMKSDFLSTASHELRTPLTSVLGFARMVEKRLARFILPHVPLDDARATQSMFQIMQNLRIIAEEGDRLTALINDILDLAKLDSGRFVWCTEPVDLAEVVDRSLAAVSVLAAQKGLAVRREIPDDLPAVNGDRGRLIQVLINLLSNAVKFTPAGVITCRASRDGEAVAVSVADTGVGISEQDQALVFDKFRQLGDTLTDKPTGTGLGLAICKEIVEAHGGTIGVSSTPGRGSTFTFHLPLTHPRPG